MIKVTLKDNVVKEYSEGVTVLDIAKDISEGLARNACCGLVNGEVQDLRYPVSEDSTVEICTFDTPEGKRAFRHTASHVMAQAIKRLYPDMNLLSLDFDSGVSDVNVTNRLMLMTNNLR